MVNAEIYDQDQAFWNNYIKARPQIPDSFFERIFAYHADHGGEFGVVHDAGAGVGVHSRRLAHRFGQVIVTDPSEQNIQIAQDQLPANGQYQFHREKLEQTIDFPSNSVDMVFASTMMHFTDLGKAIEAVTHQLKPGGTFVVTGVGMLNLKSAHEGAIWEKFYQAGNRQVLRADEANKSRSWIRVASSAFDAVPIPEKYFEPGAQRIKLNHEDLVWYNHVVPPEYAEELPRFSQIGGKDVVTRESNAEWNCTSSLTGLKDHLDTFPFRQDNEEFAELWRQLEESIGSGQVEGVWPASLILATRR